MAIVPGRVMYWHASDRGALLSSGAERGRRGRSSWRKFEEKENCVGRASMALWPLIYGYSLSLVTPKRGTQRNKYFNFTLLLPYLLSVVSVDCPIPHGTDERPRAQSRWESWRVYLGRHIRRSPTHLGTLHGHGDSLSQFFYLIL